VVFWSGTREEYLRLYDEAAQALKSVDTRLRVGGPSTAAGEWVETLAAHAASAAIPLDFVTTHTYRNLPLDVRPSLSRHGFDGIPVWWTEWGVHRPAIRPEIPRLEGHYTYPGTSLTYVPTWAGGMFEALMPDEVVPETTWGPRSFGLNDLRNAQVQIKYDTQVLHDPVWGMSPSSTADDTGDYAECGVEGLDFPTGDQLSQDVTPGTGPTRARPVHDHGGSGQRPEQQRHPALLRQGPHLLGRENLPVNGNPVDPLGLPGIPQGLREAIARTGTASSRKAGEHHWGNRDRDLVRGSVRWLLRTSVADSAC
jgi:hypothetical protein